MVGICFGHQIIAEALGGKVSKMRPERSSMGMYTGKENILLQDSFFDIPAVKESLKEYSSTSKVAQ